MKSFRFVLLAALSTVVLYACGNSASDASSGLTQAQVQTMITQATTPLENQITALQSQVAAIQSAAEPAVFIKAPNAPAVKVQLKSQLRNKSTSTSTTTCTGLGTLTGRPDSSDPLSTDNISGVSCAGYYFTVSGAATSTDNAVIQPPPPSVAIGYDSPGCTGNAYALESFNGTGITQGAVANGAVFTVGDPTSPANYLMLKAGTASTTPNILSVLQKGSCISFSGTLSGYALVTNDSTASGVPSAPIPGPVTIG